MLGMCGIEIKPSVDGLERPADPRDHHVTRAKLGGAMPGLEKPLHEYLRGARWSAQLAPPELGFARVREFRTEDRGENSAILKGDQEPENRGDDRRCHCEGRHRDVESIAVVQK